MRGIHNNSAENSHKLLLEIKHTSSTLHDNRDSKSLISLSSAPVTRAGPNKSSYDANAASARPLISRAGKEFLSLSVGELMQGMLGDIYQKCFDK